jgi:hypothetical protein
VFVCVRERKEGREGERERVRERERERERERVCVGFKLGFSSGQGIVPETGG